jgi:hypothetical protein
MNVIAVIIDLEEVRKILLHLVKIGRGGAPLRRPLDLVPKAEGTRCNVPDRRKNYGF